MKRIVAALLFAALCATAVQAQGTTTGRRVTTCGALSLTGQQVTITVDATGNLCTNASVTDTTVLASQTPVAAGAATATAGLLLGGQYDSTQKTLTNGQQAAYSMSARGALMVATGADAFAVSLNATPSLANGNGTILAPTANAADGIAPVVCGSGVSSCVLKASPGNFYSAYAECSAACWLMLFNSTSAPSNGATTAGVASGNMTECIPINAGGAGSISNTGLPPSVYTVGITAAISSTTCATLTLATTGFVNGKVK